MCSDVAERDAARCGRWSRSALACEIRKTPPNAPGRVLEGVRVAGLGEVELPEAGAGAEDPVLGPLERGRARALAALAVGVRRAESIVTQRVAKDEP